MKPIYLMHEDGLTPLQVGAVVEGINLVLNSVGMENRPQVHNYGVWRQNGWLSDDRKIYRAYQSVDWYLARAKCSRGFNCGVMYKDLINEPWQQAQEHFDVVAVHSGDITEGSGGWYIGCGSPFSNVIVSLSRFQSLRPALQRECIITEVAHEVSHMFWTPYDKRGHSITEALGPHCTNRCIMRQGWSVPDDWVRMTEDRIRYGAFCPACTADLRRFFRTCR